jgi:acyl carrier protein
MGTNVMTWDRKSVESKVIEVFVKYREAQVDIDTSTRIVADLGIDSLGVMEVLSDLEDEFELVIPNDSLKQFETVGDVISAITERLEQDGKLSA